MKLVKVHDEYGMPIWIEISKVCTVQRQLGGTDTLVRFDARNYVLIRETPEEFQAAVASSAGQDTAETGSTNAKPA